MNFGSQQVQELYTARAGFYHFLFIQLMGYGRKVKRFFRKTDYVAPNMKILDAGCGTGNMTRALYEVAEEKAYGNIIFHAFDLTQTMLDVFWFWIQNVGAKNITLRQANVLNPDQLPGDWSGYDLIVTSAMLEYLSKEGMWKALAGLKRLLKDDGRLLVAITKRNFVTDLFIKGFWETNELYNDEELKKIFSESGFSQFKVVDSFWLSSFSLIEAKK